MFVFYALCILLFGCWFFIILKGLFLSFLLVGCVAGLEQFIARVFKGGKVTIPRRVREVLGVSDGDYVRLALIEVIQPVSRGKVDEE